MSIYSGFATRQLETSYNKQVFAALYVVQRALTRQIIAVGLGRTGSQAILLTEREQKTLSSAYTKMCNLELRK